MTHPTLQFQLDSAKAYQSLFVPALFEAWTSVVADAARIQSGHRVLDVACGTGVLARHVAVQSGRRGYVAGVDPNAGMLQVARELDDAVEWREGVAESLPFLDASFDAVVSQFGLMFFQEPVRAIREMLRVLMPGGRMAVAVWDSLDENPAYAAEVGLVERVAGRRAADALRAPFALGDAQGLGALFSEAGVASVDVSSHAGSAEFPSLRIMLEADLRGWLPLVGIHLSEEKITRTLEEAEAALRPYVTPAGTVVFDTRTLIVTGTNPLMS